LKDKGNIEDYKLHYEDIIISPDSNNKEIVLPEYRACYHQKHKIDIKNFIKFQVCNYTVN